MADQEMDNLRSEVQQLRQDIQSITQTLRDMASEQGERAYARARETLGTARERAVKAEKALEHQIEERPLASILVVFIGGLIVGLLLQSRR